MTHPSKDYKPRDRRRKVKDDSKDGPFFQRTVRPYTLGRLLEGGPSFISSLGSDVFQSLIRLLNDGLSFGKT
ncbi:hypothetical protein HAX54_022330, partial [Datura stramonium]|nr:hypothetical protein [Datura stramonium]